MRSYFKVYSTLDQKTINSHETEFFNTAYWLQNARKSHIIANYNFLSCYGIPQTSPNFPLVWYLLDTALSVPTSGSIYTFNGQQLADRIYNLRNYSTHPRN